MRDVRGKFPFRVERNSVRTLVDQVFDGLRDAIVCGRYKPGDLLPPMRVLTQELGVSRIVANEAIRRLKKTGLINSRPRVGCVVLGRCERLWRGEVLLVRPIGDDNYYDNVYAGAIRDILVAAGYQFHSCTVPQLQTKEYDLSVLRHMLRQTPDLVVLFSLKPEIVGKVARTGVRYVTISQFAADGARKPEFSAAIDWNVAMLDLVADLRRTSVATVEQVTWANTLSDAVPFLRKAGIAVRNWRIRTDGALPRIQAVSEAGYRAFVRRLDSPDPKLPELFLFADDHLAEGAFLALSERGFRIPDDVGVVSWANRGRGPLFGRPLSRLEMDPFSDGRKSAAWILEILKARRAPDRLVLGPVYIPGQTLKGDPR